MPLYHEFHPHLQATVMHLHPITGDDSQQKVITFSFVTPQFGQWGGHSVKLLLVGQLFRHPSAEHFVTAEAFINNFTNNAVWKVQCQFLTASMIHNCLPASFHLCQWQTCCWKITSVPAHDTRDHLQRHGTTSALAGFASYLHHTQPQSVCVLGFVPTRG
jgi:hypothetical protein